MNNRPRPWSDKQLLWPLIEAWRKANWIRNLDWAFGRFIEQEGDRTDHECPPELILAAILVSHQAGRGHVGLNLSGLVRNPDRTLGLPPEADSNAAGIMTPAEALHGLTLPEISTVLEQQTWAIGPGMADTPLVLEDGLLYLRRYWDDQATVRKGIHARLTADTDLPLQAVRTMLDRLFPTNSTSQLDWQKIACALALLRPFAVVTGGPGTGKTTTVLKLLLTLQQVGSEAPTKCLRIRLAAPTGKAAARLNQSLRQQSARFSEWFSPELAAEMSRTILAEPVTTLHRLLGTLPDGRGFRYHRLNPLPADVVVVDEASMVDVSLMACLMDALPSNARLILLGDKDQLASVEAGAVLGELCQHAERGGYWQETVDWIEKASGEKIPVDFQSKNPVERIGLPAEAASPSIEDRTALELAFGDALDQSITMLRVSHRFSANSGIGQFAAAVNAGDQREACRLLEQGRADLELLVVNKPQDVGLRNKLLKGYAGYLEEVKNGPDGIDPTQLDDWAHSVLERHAKFQLLVAVRRGPFGVERLNDWIIEILRQERVILDQGLWYPGRPVIVTRNDYNLRLMNGDIGMTLPVQGHLRVVFPDSESPSGLRWIQPSRLGNVETVFAMTVHKSQGSEFEEVALLLPDRPSPIVTRELIYTGITRAASRFTLLLPNPATLQDGISRRLERTSGNLH
jgi:exodeoxyribonuclease V alpha subunit